MQALLVSICHSKHRKIVMDIVFGDEALNDIPRSVRQVLESAVCQALRIPILNYHVWPSARGALWKMQQAIEKHLLSKVQVKTMIRNQWADCTSWFLPYVHLQETVISLQPWLLQVLRPLSPQGLTYAKGEALGWGWLALRALDIILFHSRKCTYLHVVHMWMILNDDIHFTTIYILLVYFWKEYASSFFTNVCFQSTFAKVVGLL